MSKVFLYVEFQNSVDFSKLDTDTINAEMKAYAGLKSKTWLSGMGTQSVGGFYEFDTVENAQNYIDNYLTPAMSTFGCLSVRLFDGDVVADAARDMDSPFYE